MENNDEHHYGYIEINPVPRKRHFWQTELAPGIKWPLIGAFALGMIYLIGRFFSWFMAMWLGTGGIGGY